MTAKRMENIMGASNFCETIWTDDDYKKAYQKAVDEALYEHGVDPYSGSIATTAGVKRHLPSGQDKAVSLDEAYKLSMTRLDGLGKRTHCEAVKVYEVAPAKTETLVRNYEAELTIDANIRKRPEGKTYAEMISSASLPTDERDAVIKAFTKHVRKVAKRDGVLSVDGKSVKISEEDAKSLVVSEDYFDYTFLPPTKVTTTVPDGARVTRYFIISTNQFRMVSWDDGYESQAEARKALPKVLKEHGGNSYEIISMTRREEGAPLVSHKVEEKESKTVKVVVKGTVGKVLSPSKKTGRTGWTFYGWVAE